MKAQLFFLSFSTLLFLVSVVTALSTTAKPGHAIRNGMIPAWSRWKAYSDFTVHFILPHANTNQVIVATSGVQSGDVVSLNASSGNIMWSTHVSNRPRSGILPKASQGKSVLVVDYLTVRRIDVATGKVCWIVRQNRASDQQLYYSFPSTFVEAKDGSVAGYFTAVNATSKVGVMDYIHIASDLLQPNVPCGDGSSSDPTITKLLELQPGDQWQYGQGPGGVIRNGFHISNGGLILVSQQSIFLLRQGEIIWNISSHGFLRNDTNCLLTPKANHLLIVKELSSEYLLFGSVNASAVLMDATTGKPTSLQPFVFPATFSGPRVNITSIDMLQQATAAMVIVRCGTWVAAFSIQPSDPTKNVQLLYVTSMVPSSTWGEKGMDNIFDATRQVSLSTYDPESGKFWFLLARYVDGSYGDITVYSIIGLDAVRGTLTSISDSVTGSRPLSLTVIPSKKMKKEKERATQSTNSKILVAFDNIFDIGATCAGTPSGYATYLFDASSLQGLAYYTPSRNHAAFQHVIDVHFTPEGFSGPAFFAGSENSGSIEAVDIFGALAPVVPPSAANPYGKIFQHVDLWTNRILPSPDGKRVFTIGKLLVAIDTATTGEVLWNRNISSENLGILTLWKNDFLVLGSSGTGGKPWLAVINASTGKPLMNLTHQLLGSVCQGGPSGAMGFMSSSDFFPFGCLSSLDANATTYEMLWGGIVFNKEEGTFQTISPVHVSSGASWLYAYGENPDEKQGIVAVDSSTRDIFVMELQKIGQKKQKSSKKEKGKSAATFLLKLNWKMSNAAHWVRPTKGDRVVLVNYTSGKLEGWSLQRPAKQLWKTSDSISNTPFFDATGGASERIFDVSGGKTVFAFNTQNGNLSWTAELHQTKKSQPVPILDTATPSQRKQEPLVFQSYWLPNGNTMVAVNVSGKGQLLYDNLGLDPVCYNYFPVNVQRAGVIAGFCQGNGGSLAFDAIHGTSLFKFSDAPSPTQSGSDVTMVPTVFQGRQAMLLLQSELPDWNGIYDFSRQQSWIISVPLPEVLN